MMRYRSDHKEKAKAAILEAGAIALRQHGFNGIGVDGVAAAAGVTSGAFYSNFANKEALLKETIEFYLGRPIFTSDQDPPEQQRGSLAEFISSYISSEHRSNSATGCVMPALSADVSRSALGVREVYQQRVEELVKRIAETIPSTEHDSLRRARGIVSLMVGAILVSRSMPDGEGADQILDAALQNALRLIAPD